jgi:hypothetical protein
VAPNGGSDEPSLTPPLFLGFFSSINESTFPLTSFLGWALSAGIGLSPISSVEVLLFFADEGLLGMRE